MKLELRWLAPPPEPVPSPCVGVCTLDDHQVCIGCARTGDEIAGWLSMSDREKQEVLDRIDARALGTSEPMGDGRPSYPILRFMAKLGTRLGHTGSMVLLGAIYEADDGSAEGIRKANELYRAAARKGNAQAMWSLGVNYLSSKGGETDHDKAIEWIGRAADSGHGMAAWAMGKMHLAGRLVDQDRERGLLLLQRSAVSGFRDAGELLAEIYRTGQYGVTVSEVEARRWLDLTQPLAVRLRQRLGPRRRGAE